MNEGADWAIAINDIQNAKSVGEVAMASISFLPFVSGGMLKVYRGVGVAADAIEITAKEASQIKNVLKSFPNTKYFNSIVRHRSSLVLQRSDLEFTAKTVMSLSKGYAPFVRRANGVGFDQVHLHHVGRRHQDGNILIEVRAPHNTYNPKNGGPLHIPGPAIDYGEEWRSGAWRQGYWKSRLQDALSQKAVPVDVVNETRDYLKDFDLSAYN